MNDSDPERRLAENEVVFRQHNASLKQAVDAHKAIAKEEGQRAHQFDVDTPLSFFCECSDENCRTRIQISPRSYDKIHASPDKFTIAPGHEVPAIERVTYKGSAYYVVTKLTMPPRTADKLNDTDVENV